MRFAVCTSEDVCGSWPCSGSTHAADFATYTAGAGGKRMGHDYSVDWTTGLMETGSEDQMHSILELKHSDLAGNGLYHLQGCGRSVYSPVNSYFIHKQLRVSSSPVPVNMCST